MTHTLQLAGETLEILPQRAVWWAAKRMLLLADLHIDKGAHFRKAGVPVSGTLMQQELQRLDALVQFRPPSHLIILGDLFHSQANQETEAFNTWAAAQPFSIELLLGNHDRHAARSLAATVSRSWQRVEPPFLLTHEPPNPAEPATGYALCGHLHPRLTLSGRGQQTLKLPCFYFNDRYAVLPAFASLAGGYAVERLGHGFACALTPQKVFAPVRVG